MNKQILAKGVWEEGVSWKFVLSDVKPNPDLCTAAFCVVTYGRKLILVKQKNRGWELPGGHIDTGEDLEDGIIREVIEESGATIENPHFFGFKQISPESPIPNKNHVGKFYPFPHSFVIYYFAEASEMLNISTAEDVLETTRVGLKDARNMLAKGHKHDELIDYLKVSGKITLDE